MKRSALTSARILDEELPKGGFRFRPVFLTPTYRPDVVWAPGHITALLQCIRQWLKRRGHGFHYVWVAEIQEGRAEKYEGQNCLHYHLLIWLPLGLTLPKPDKQGWWPHGMTKIEWARRPVGYMAKYASKGGKPDLIPKGARLTSSGGLSKEGRAERSWWLCPQYVREKWDMEHRPCRAPGGGWFSRLTGEWMPSAFILAFRAADWSWVKLVPRESLTGMPAYVEVVGSSSWIRDAFVSVAT
jgi:hypothetical protein